MRRLGLILLLSLLAPVAAPVQAEQSATSFTTLERCERYLDRWRDRLDRGRSGGWSDVASVFVGAYCVERAGRFFVVYSS